MVTFFSSVEQRVSSKCIVNSYNILEHDLQGNSFSQLQGLCFMLINDTGCSELGYDVLYRMREELQPYVQSVDTNHDQQMEVQYLQYNVSVLGQEISEDGLSVSFRVDEFYKGQSTHGGSSIAAFVTDTMPPTEGGVRDRTTIQETRYIQPCAVKDYLNGSYGVQCSLSAECLFVNFTLMYLNYSAFTDMNMGFNEAKRFLIYNATFCGSKKNQSVAPSHERHGENRRAGPYWSRNGNLWRLHTCNNPVPTVSGEDLRKCLSSYNNVFMAGKN